MPTVFISYRRDDTAGEAGRLADDLSEAYGRSRVFIDVDSIPAATNFEDRIQEALDSCQVVFVLIGDEWLTARLASGERRLDAEGDYLRHEIAAALQRSDVAVVPVLVEGAKMPGAADLPAEIAGLAKINAAELTNRHWGSDLRALRAIARRYDSPRSRALHWVRAHAVRIALALVAVGVIVAVAIIAAGGGSSGGDAPIAEQVDEIRAGLQEEGFEVGYSKLELHQGAPSHLFIATKLDQGGGRASSDEVRIYDDVDGALEPQLTYRPEVTQSSPPEVLIATAFQVRTVTDIDGDGQSEILGSYETNLAGEEYQRVPVLIARESGEGYLVTPLLTVSSFERQVTAGLPTFDFGPAGGQRAPTAWASEFALDTRGLYSDVRATLVTRVVDPGREDPGLTLNVEPPGTDPALPLYVRFWGIEMQGPTPRVTALCVFSGGAPLPEPLPVRTGSEEIEELLGKPLRDALTDADLVVGDFVDGNCVEPPA